MDTFEDLQAFRWFRNYGMTTGWDLIRKWLSIDCHAYFAWDDLGPVWKHTRGGVEAAKLLVTLSRQRPAEQVTESSRRGYAHLQPRQL